MRILQEILVGFSGVLDEIISGFLRVPSEVSPGILPGVSPDIPREVSSEIPSRSLARFLPDIFQRFFLGSLLKMYYILTILGNPSNFPEILS